MIVSASLASVLVRCYGLLLKQGDIGARAGLLQRTDCVHREHHEQSEELVT